MTYKQTSDYFENLCKFKLVGHSDDQKKFMRINIDDIIDNSAKFKLGFPAVLLELPENKLSGETDDSAFKNRYVALTFLSKVPPQDKTRELEVYDEMETLGLKFMAKVNHDYKNFTDRKIHSFNFNDVRWFKIGPVADNLYGQRFEFPIGFVAKEFRIYNANDWT